MLKISLLKRHESKNKYGAYKGERGSCRHSSVCQVELEQSDHNGPSAAVDTQLVTDQTLITAKKARTHPPSFLPLLSFSPIVLNYYTTYFLFLLINLYDFIDKFIFFIFI